MNREHLQSVPYAEAGIQDDTDNTFLPMGQAALYGLYFAAQGKSAPTGAASSIKERQKRQAETWREQGHSISDIEEALRKGSDPNVIT